MKTVNHARLKIFAIVPFLFLTVFLSGCLKSEVSIIPIKDRGTVSTGKYTLCEIENRDIQNPKNCEEYHVTEGGSRSYIAKGQTKTYEFSTYIVGKDENDSMGIIEIREGSNDHYYYGKLQQSMNTSSSGVVYETLIVTVPSCVNIKREELSRLERQGSVRLVPTKTDKNKVECYARTIDGVVNYLTAEKEKREIHTDYFASHKIQE